MNVEFVSNPAIRFPNGEIFISVATYVSEDDRIKWSSPSQLRPRLRKSEIANIGEPPSQEHVHVISKVFEDILSLPEGTVNTVLYREYGPKKNSHLWDENVYLNTDNFKTVFEGGFSTLYYDETQIATAYVIDKRIVSIAFDNTNGAVTVLTEPSYQKKGYSTACLSRLIHEYRKLGKKLGYATEDDNEAAIKTAKKCGMAEWGFGFWVKISPESSIKYESILSEL